MLTVLTQIGDHVQRIAAPRRNFDHNQSEGDLDRGSAATSLLGLEDKPLRTADAEGARFALPSLPWKQ